MFLKMVSPNRLVSLREQFLEELEEDLQKERFRQYSEEYRKALLERLEKGTLIYHHSYHRFASRIAQFYVNGTDRRKRWSIVPLTDGQFDLIVEKGEVNENIIIDQA